MDAIALLQHDHQEVEQLFRQFERLTERAHKSKRKIVMKVIRALAIHAAGDTRSIPGEVTRDWAWGGSTGKGVRVCILDSGVDPGHPLVGEIQRAVEWTEAQDRWCRREGINPNLYYKWSKEFLEAGKARLTGDDRPFCQIAAEMGRRRGATTVSADEHGLSSAVSGHQGFNNTVNIREGDVVE